ncbi:hypothetical protein C6P42_004953 [Pichia californica]|nr:hypothetical protein C6P42_004953 [[Candida] californica]
MTDQQTTPTTPRTSSYQFAPSSIQGWNDCPILPRNVSSKILPNSPDSPKRTVSTRKNRRPMYVNHLENQNNTSPQQSLSVPKVRSTSNSIPLRIPSSSSLSTPSPPPPPPKISNQSKLPPSEDIKKFVQSQIHELLNYNSNLTEDQYLYHKQKLEDSVILKSDSNIYFLQNLFEAWNKSDRNINDITVVNILYDFTSNNSNIAWLLSLKKIMSNIK